VTNKTSLNQTNH